MILKLKFYFVIIFLSITQLSTSSFGYLPLLKNFASQDIAPKIHLYKAAKYGDRESAQILQQITQNEAELHWQSLLAKLDIPEAQFYLAHTVESSSERKRLLQQAAAGHYAPALHELAILETKKSSKERLLKEAVEMNYYPAIKALYKWYWLQQDYESALPLLEQVAEQEPAEARELALYLWRNHHPRAAISWFEQGVKLGDAESKRYLAMIDKYWEKPKSLLVAHDQNGCAMTLQFVVTSLDTLKQAKQFASEFQQDNRLSELPICLNTIYWADEALFQCDSQPINNYRIGCNLNVLAEVFEPNDFTHLVVFAAHGKANVRNGTMFLDLADTYSVFVHELAHFVGFIDEYPLSGDLANYYCDSNQRYPNIVVVEPDQDIASVDLSFWYPHSQSISLSKARTCNNHANQAYKFTSKLSFMEFHDADLIPPMYLSLWRERLLQPQHMKPAAINIAQALEEVGNSPGAQVWWQRYHDWLN